MPRVSLFSHSPLMTLEARARAQPRPRNQKSLRQKSCCCWFIAYTSAKPNIYYACSQASERTRAALSKYRYTSLYFNYTRACAARPVYIWEVSRAAPRGSRIKFFGLFNLELLIRDDDALRSLAFSVNYFEWIWRWVVVYCLPMLSSSKYFSEMSEAYSKNKFDKWRLIFFIMVSRFTKVNFTQLN